MSGYILKEKNILFTLFGLIFLSTSFGCPSICTCKWKKGKQTVECRNKGLATLPTEIEQGTQVLVFDGNNLQTIQRHAFLSRGLINLQKLHLESCSIGRIDDEAFAQLSNLVELDLSKNLLTDIPSRALRRTPTLRELNLAGNPISSIPAQSFVHTPGLVHLDISNGRIKTVSPIAFQPLTLLETIQLESNKLKELPESVIITFESSHGVRVHDNPWFCDCRALPLWRLLVVRRVPHPVSPTCNAPHRIAGTQFSSLEEKDFACPPEIRPVIRVVQGVAGENATVTCPVQGQPPPDVLWYIGDRPVVNGSILGLGPQRVYIMNGGHKNKVSHLVITGAQEADSGQIRCIAVNPAGRATANFTLAVTMKAISDEPFNSGHIAGISIGLIVLALIIFVVAFLLFARTRTSSTPTPVKENSPSCSLPRSPSEPNPIQKPPRLTELSTSSSTDPDLISEVEKSARSNQSNGYLPNGKMLPSTSDGGDYIRMEGDSLYPSAIWDSQFQGGPALHEHYNPGFVANESPLHPPFHSTPVQATLDTNFNHQIYGYPPDYGLPIPEVEEESAYGASYEIVSSEKSFSQADKTHCDLRNELLAINNNIYGKLSQYNADTESNVYSLFNSHPQGSAVRIQENKMAEEITLEEVGSRINVAEGAESPQVNGPPGERPWIPGCPSYQAVPLGVPVLPPLPKGLNRIKSRDSPDEGYQEGTEV